MGGVCDAMPCFHPLSAYQSSDGTIHFDEKAHFRIVRSLSLPCGRCTGCRLERSRQWAVRIMHEAQLHERNCFITLTYATEHLPALSTLFYPDFQRFMKRLRKTVGPVRFYMCGEYGERLDRPHYHACIFGYDFRGDRVPWRRSSAATVDRSAELERLWPFGHSSVGDLTMESAAYVARYVMKKVTGDLAEAHYQALDESTGELVVRSPEFCRMSLKPGIGAGWFEKYKSDVYPSDEVIVKGRPTKPPRYYDKKLAQLDEDAFEEIRYKRYLDAQAGAVDGTDERLAVREAVVQARIRHLSRTL